MDILSFDIESDKRGNVTCTLPVVFDGNEHHFVIRLRRKSNKVIVEHKESPVTMKGLLFPTEIAGGRPSECIG